MKEVVGAALLYGKRWWQNITLWKQRLREEMEHPWAGGSEQLEEDRQDSRGRVLLQPEECGPCTQMDAGSFCEDLTSKGAKGPRRPFHESGDW